MAYLKLAEVQYLRACMRQELAKQMPKFQLLSAFIAPYRLNMNPGYKNDGARKDQKILDNQAGRSLRTFSSGMMNGSTPRSRPWFNLTTPDQEKAQSTPARKYFSDVKRILSEHFQISNLYRVLPSAYKDLGVFSNAAYAMLPHPRFGFYFYPFEMGTFGFICDAEGQPCMFWRDFSYTVRQVVENYATLNDGGKIDWTNIPEWVKAHWDASRYTEIVVLSQVIVPNKDFSAHKLQYSLNPLDNKYQCYTFVQSTGSGLPPQHSTGFRNENAVGLQSDFIKVSGYDYFPIIIPRWEVTGGNDWGLDGPGDLALSDIMSLQEMEAYRMEAVAKLVKPAMIGPASLKRHQSSILAGGITYLDETLNAANIGFKPAFEIDPKLSELINNKAEVRQAIKESFFENLFLMLSNEATVSHVTAVEINEKNAERMAALAPSLSQQDDDQNSKLIYNGQFLLEKAGRLPPRPRELQGETLRPEYISVLAQASKAAQMTSLEKLVNFAVSYAKQTGDTAAGRILNAEVIIRKYADYVGTDPEVLFDDVEFAKVKKAIMIQQQQAAQAAQMQQNSEIAKNFSSAKTGEGNMLDQLNGQ